MATTCNKFVFTCNFFYQYVTLQYVLLFSMNILHIDITQ